MHDFRRLTILIHAHYEKELTLILKKLRKLLVSNRINCEVVILATDGISDQYFSYLRLNFPNVQRYQGLGRNFGSLIHASNEGFLTSPLTLHLHTKRSPQMPLRMGRLWLAFLLSRLVRSPKKIEPVLKRVFESNGIYYPKIAWIFTKKSRQLPEHRDLFESPEILSFEKKENSLLNFPAGGMFIVRTDKLNAWAKRVESAMPRYRAHSSTHGEVEHFLERHLGLYFESTL